MRQVQQGRSDLPVPQEAEMSAQVYDNRALDCRAALPEWWVRKGRYQGVALMLGTDWIHSTHLSGWGWHIG